MEPFGASFRGFTSLVDSRKGLHVRLLAWSCSILDRLAGSSWSQFWSPAKQALNFDSCYSILSFLTPRTMESITFIFQQTQHSYGSAAPVDLLNSPYLKFRGLNKKEALQIDLLLDPLFWENLQISFSSLYFYMVSRELSIIS